jgi:pyrroline-5-carboxylate reductase
MKIALIGFGNMGSAIYKGLLKIHSAKDVFVCDKTARSGVPNMSVDANETIAGADVVILAVKPQQFDELTGGLTTELSKKMIISIMAGVSIATIRKRTGAGRVIRSMPNLAASVGQSLTGWVAGKGAKPADKKLAGKIFSSFGAQVELKNEGMINALTALSGSGPAYFFHLTELLQEKAEKMGFGREQARLIAEKTLLGSAHLLGNPDLPGTERKSAADWRKSVTSKGGTTQAALEYMKKHGFARIFNRALDRAKNRAEELNNKQA